MLAGAQQRSVLITGAFEQNPVQHAEFAPSPEPVAPGQPPGAVAPDLTQQVPAPVNPAGPHVVLGGFTGSAQHEPLPEVVHDSLMTEQHWFGVAAPGDR